VRPSFWGGLVTALALSGMSQDGWGSLDAYIAHLRTPGVWLQVPMWVWVTLLVFGIAGSAFDSWVSK